MIFAPTAGYLFLFLMTILPMVGVLGSLVWLACLVHRLRQRDRPRPRLGRPRWWATALVLSMLNLWTAYLWYESHQIRHAIREEERYRKSRQTFILPRDFQYGEQLIPAGSQIERYDASDNGEPLRPLKLTGLRAVRFPHPVPMAGVQAIAFEAFPGEIELAADQDFDGLTCRRGQIARFDVPLIEYDLVAEFGKEAPDGPAARFRPSEWRFRDCEDGPIRLKPPSPTPAAFADFQ